MEGEWREKRKANGKEGERKSDVINCVIIIL